jgi:chromate transporter
MMIIERGLAPPAIGLLFAGAYAVLQASNPGPFALMVTAATTLLIYVWGVGPYIIMGAVTLIYLPIALL